MLLSVTAGRAQPVMVTNMCIPDRPVVAPEALCSFSTDLIEVHLSPIEDVPSRRPRAFAACASGRATRGAMRRPKRLAV